MTKFEFDVKTKLMQLGKNQKWLLKQVSKVYSGNLDSSVISRAITEKENIYPQVKIAIAKVLGIRF